MEGPRLTVLVILLIFIFFSPDPSTVRYHNNDEVERERVEKAQDFNALANTTYGQLSNSGLNLTGFRDEDNFALHLLPVAQDASRAQEADIWSGFDRQTPVYHDIDSQIQGDFARLQNLKLDLNRELNLTELDPSTTYISNVFDRNVTDNEGQLTIELHGIDEYSKSRVREVRADLSIFSESSPGRGWDAKLKGLHFPHGGIIMTTASRKFNALPALPHFMLKEKDFQRARAVMNHSLTEIWNHINQGQLDENPLLAQPSCELVVWLHQKPMQGTGFYIDQIEKELLLPDGAPLGQVPPLSFVATILSPDCGFVLSSNSLIGPKAATYTELVRRLTAAFCLVMAGQIFLLKRQMQRCATPSTRSRVSYHTFGIAAFGDGLIMMGLVAILVVDLSAFLLTGAAAFLCCIHVAFLEVKFIFDIWTVQVGDPMTAQAERERRTVATTTPVPAAPQTTLSIEATADTSREPTVPPFIPSVPLATATAPITNEEGLPLPATARASATSPPIVLTPNQNGDLVPETPRASFASLYSRFYFALVNLMFFSLWATSWSATPKHIYFNILAFCWFSLWLPQIYRNVLRNCRKALTWEYIIGTTVLRAIPILYWYVDDRNILSITTNRRTAMFLIGWLWFQIAVLVSQQYLGPRLFVPESWCPPAYDYHPVLYDDLEAGGLPIGEVTSASEGKDKDMSLEKDKSGNRKLFDCAICMNEIDVPVLSKDEKQNTGGGRSWLEQKNYMVTPCRHIFHSECLEGWMNLRLACPVCRESLPPL